MLLPHFGRNRCEPVWLTSHLQTDGLPDFIVPMALRRMPQLDYSMGILVPNGIIEQVCRFIENKIRQPDFFYAPARVGTATPPPDGTF